jgi:SAM-dependent methyltransferase
MTGTGEDLRRSDQHGHGEGGPLPGSRRGFRGQSCALYDRPMQLPDRQDVFRWLLKTRLFSRLYGRVIGPASPKMFSEFLQRELLDHLPSHARVLEVGCGPGLQALEVARMRPDVDLIASDFSEEFVRLSEGNAAKARAAESNAVNSAIRFVVADAMDLSRFPPSSFDGIYSMTAIKHFPDPVRGLRECVRLLKPGGRLVVAEIRRESSLEEVRGLVELFDVPRWLRGAVARLIHSKLCEECPPLVDVRGWLAKIQGDGRKAAVHELAGRPAWGATIA